jgi:hypothetical protein
MGKCKQKVNHAQPKAWQYKQKILAPKTVSNLHTKAKGLDFFVIFDGSYFSDNYAS